MALEIVDLLSKRLKSEYASPPEIVKFLVAQGLNFKPYSDFKRFDNKSTISSAM